MPEPGDKLMPEKRPQERPAQRLALECPDGRHRPAKTIRITIVPEKTIRISRCALAFCRNSTSEEEIPYALRRDSDKFDYSYALTVHKAQGSQWDNVVLFEQSGAFPRCIAPAGFIQLSRM